MTGKPKDQRCNEYRLVVIDAKSMQILTNAAATGPLLPRETLPPYTRVAEALTQSIEQRYGLRTIQLALLPGAEELGYCAVHEITDSREAVSESLSFTALYKIASGEFVSEERATVLKITRGEASEWGRFARLGWIDELLAKTGSLRDRGTMPVIRQLNQGIDFCLLSITDLTGRRMWFKAVGEPNTREYALTAELTRRFPAYLPRILTTIPEWNGWVTDDVKGVPLNESDATYECERALTALVIMQKEMATDLASISALGAKDWTCARLASLSEPFFAEAQCAMQAQTSAKSKPLADSELYQLKKDIEGALDVFSDAGIPETLIHGDIGHGNIIATSNGPVFLDWAETYVGHPFLSAEQLLADFGRSRPHLSRELSSLRLAYADHWRNYATPKALAKVKVLAPAVAAFAYAVMTWEANADRPGPPRAWPLLRSMLRRTKQELDHLSEMAA